MNPWEFAAALLNDDPNVSAASLKKLVGGRETQVNLTQHIPVHITYFTAWVDDSGKLQLRSDVYGHDRGWKRPSACPPRNLATATGGPRFTGNCRAFHLPVCPSNATIHP